jgi:predicted nucleic acid-binding Zn ribbon protein
LVAGSQVHYDLEWLGFVMAILKCEDCGNTFKADRVVDGETVTCPVCEANYRIQIKDGKITLKLSVFEEDDFGEL